MNSMAHFAKIENGIVTTVIVAEQDFIDSGAVGDPKNWVQTSYNSRGGIHYDPITGEPDARPHLRYNYASIGDVYDAEKDAFYPQQPYESWQLDELTCTWQPPTPIPGPLDQWRWNEKTTQWVEVKYE
jgi:hypothetical protein